MERSKRYNPEDFTNAQLGLVMAWAYGYSKNQSASRYLKKNINTIKGYSQDIMGKFKDTPGGMDNRAKAVAFAASKGLISAWPFKALIDRYLTEEEISFIGLRTSGYTREDISQKLEVSKIYVDRRMNELQDLLGTKNDYGTITWTVVNVLNRKHSA